MPQFKALFFRLVTLLLLSMTLTPAYTTERFVLVIIDGLRYSEGLGDPTGAYTPYMAGLAEEGTLINDFQNDGFTYTSRAIPAIWCGAWTEINTFNDPFCDGNSNNTTELPTVFEYYRKHLDRPAEDCVYTIKNLCSWKASLDPDYGMDYWPDYHEVGSTDTDVWHETEQVIANQSPRFLLMYLADVDHAGHSGNWHEYLQAITTADSLVNELWNTLQSDPDYTGVTTMMITNDHGRHDYDFSGHGDGCAGCRQIQLLAIGPDIQNGFLSETPRTIPDIAPTIGELLGFPTEQASGSAMVEILDQTTAILDSPEFDTGPTARGLQKLFPSPFNGALTIEYLTEDHALSSVSIFNLAGEQIWKKDISSLGRGRNQLKWLGVDDQGIDVAAGVYIVRLANGSHSSTQKALLLK